MQYFIGIVPPDEYKNRIINFQQQWENNTIMNVVEPHITLKAQGGLTSDRKWLTKVIATCREFSPFEIELSTPDFFGEEILYLSCQAKDLVLLHHHLMDVIKPSEELINQYFEKEKFVAHLTLGKVYYGLSKQELEEMAELAYEHLIPFPTYTVDFVRVYQEIKSKQYVKFMDIPLGDNSLEV
ncbi:2'-5' RNA ligase family protein [Ornithinibacillus sp. 179-J 7C1 HS]|uniref:2'-5' RNA ligase family protein n=1 Tax=Ornithinibacillus sp. 179-J 7C1 HS TaxID=3142384 RepID=UPI0039A172BB